MSKTPGRWDVFFLSCFVILTTLQPYYLHGEINLFELGLYLPGIVSILSGGIPYRDFFHLRGPFELYMPAFLMKIFGENVAVLCSYFYVGTVLTLLFGLVIAARIYRTRWIFYLFVFILVARTFPRVVFTYWGGMRYALGLLAVLLAIQFFKKGLLRWIFGAGVVSGIAFFTSVEIGICAIASIGMALTVSFVLRLHPRGLIQRALGSYMGGLLFVVVPYGLYMWQTHSLGAYGECVHAVTTRMQEVINLHFISTMPQNPLEALQAMLNPTAKNFRHMTPGFLFLFLFIFLIFKIKRRALTTNHLSVICIGVYGLIMYTAAFRAIWGSQFEMALQPEKILLFFLCEEMYLWLKDLKAPVFLKFGRIPVHLSRVFLMILILSTAGYSLQRFNHRFFSFKVARNFLLGKDTASLIPLAGQETKTLTLKRVQGMTVPLKQAQELEGVVSFIERNTRPGERVLMFPELGAYSFIVDRPFIGRFPMVIFSWFKEEWHKEFLLDLQNQRPRYAIIPKNPVEHFAEVYFKRLENKGFYEDVLNFIDRHYRIMGETNFSYLYQLKEAHGQD